MILRFGLGTLLVTVTATGVLLGLGMMWYHGQENEYLRQVAIAQRLETYGADVTWEQHPPACLAWAGNVAAFKRVAVVAGGNLDSILNELPNLPEVREVVTSNNQLTRDDLDRLARLEQVTTVKIGYGPAIVSPNGAEVMDLSPDEIDARLSQKQVIKLP